MVKKKKRLAFRGRRGSGKLDLAVMLILGAFVAAGVVAAVIPGKPAQDDPPANTMGPAHGTPNGARPKSCESGGVRCASVPVAGVGDVLYGIVAAAVAGSASTRGLILVEPGGPGADAVSRPERDALGIPVEFAAYDLLVIAEPWVGKAMPSSCGQALSTFVAATTSGTNAATSLAAACAAATWTSETYTAVLRSILQRENRQLTGIVGHSFGALPATAAAEAFPQAWLIVSAPIAPPSTTGDQLVDGRIEALKAALERSYKKTCGELNLDCSLSAWQIAVDAIRRTNSISVEGRSLPVTAGDVGLAVMAAAYGLDANERWLWPTLAKLPGGDQAALVEVGRMADQIVMRFGDNQIAQGMAAFVVGTCQSFTGWTGRRSAERGSPDALLMQLAHQCAANKSEQSVWNTWPPTPRQTSTCLFWNEKDPVAAAPWARQWAEHLPGATIVKYSHNGHANLSAALQLTDRRACPILPNGVNHG